jgi:hypothetical protein
MRTHGLACPAYPCGIDYLVSSFFGAGGDFLAGLAGRLLPKDPLKIFPFLVFLSPLPIYFLL